MKEGVEIREYLGYFLEKEEKVRLLADFCQVSQRSVRDWGRSTLPKGLFLVKALAFISLDSGLAPKGIEFGSITHRAMVALAFDWITPEELAEVLGFSQAYEVYRPMGGRRPFSPAKIVLLEVILKRFQLQLEGKFAKAGKQPDYVQDVEDFQRLSELLAKVEPIMDSYLASFPAIRQEFRAALEMEGISIFMASNRLYRISEKFNALCSERSYQTYKNKK